MNTKLSLWDQWLDCNTALKVIFLGLISPALYFIMPIHTLTIKVCLVLNSINYCWIAHTVGHAKGSKMVFKEWHKSHQKMLEIVIQEVEKLKDDGDPSESWKRG